MKKMFLKLKSVEVIREIKPELVIVEELQNGEAWCRLTADKNSSMWLESFPHKDGYEIKHHGESFWHAAKNIRNIVAYD